MLLVMLLLAFGPSLIWLYWLWSRDKFQREPLSLMLWLLAAGGAISVPLVLLTVPLYQHLVPTQGESVLLHMFLVAGLPEEIAKMLPVLLFAWRSPHWDEPFDGIVYAGAAALGFHLVETILYMVGSAQGPIGEVLYQGLIRGSKPGHMLYGVAMGYFLSRVKFARPQERWKYAIAALAVPVLLHTAWNTAAQYGGSIVGGTSLADLLFSLVAWGLSVVLWVIGFQYMRADQADSPWNPEAHGIPTAPEPCPACGSRYPHTANYCQSCGNRVQAFPQARAETD